MGTKLVQSYRVYYTRRLSRPSTIALTSLFPSYGTLSVGWWFPSLIYRHWISQMPYSGPVTIPACDWLQKSILILLVEFPQSIPRFYVMSFGRGQRDPHPNTFELCSLHKLALHMSGFARFVPAVEWRAAFGPVEAFSRVARLPS